MSKRTRLYYSLVMMLLALSMAGCLIRPGQDPTSLDYDLATTVTVAANSPLPGTGIRYETADEEGAHLTIDGEKITKLKGDSVFWKGTLVPGVTVNEQLRVVWFTANNLTLAGTVKIHIDGIAPSALKPVTTSSITFNGPEVYGLAKGAKVPGTQLTYVGSSDQGAQFSGIEGYAYRQVGDSLVWEGKLREGVFLRFEGRVIQFNAGSARIAGIVTLWIGL
jgi:hypothetical protein